MIPRTIAEKLAQFTEAQEDSAALVAAIDALAESHAELVAALSGLLAELDNKDDGRATLLARAYNYAQAALTKARALVPEAK